MRTKLLCTMLGIFLGAIFVSACGDSDSGAPAATEEPMTATVTEFNAQIDALDQLETKHDADIKAAADLAAANAKEADEATSATTIHGTMATLIGHMGMCMSKGAAPNTDALSASLTSLKKEIDAHKAAMAAAADMPAATTEEARHQTAIDGLVTDMHTGHDAMAAMAGSYMCPMM